MSNLPIAADIAVRATRRQAGSALPDAPVLPGEDERPRPRRWLRRQDRAGSAG